MKAPKNNRVVVVGYEIASALGYGLQKTWNRAIKSESGLNWVHNIDIKDYPAKVVAAIPDLDFTQYDFLKVRDLSNWFSRFIPLTMVLSHDALQHAGMDITQINSYRVGIINGAALHGYDGYETSVKNMLEGGYNRISPFLLPNLCLNLGGGKTAMLYKIRGPQFGVASACATGNHVIAEAARIIQRGEADVMFAAAVEMPILEPIIYGFGNANALYKVKEGDRAESNPTLASRPYSVDRNGFVLAEGGAVLILTSLDYALKSNWKPYAEVLGLGMTGDAYHYTSPAKEPIVECIEQAIEDAQIQREEVDYINGHATSTRIGDKIEIESLKQVFGQHLKNIPISSNKSQLGHSLGATAAVEAVLSIHGMHQNTILPTINYKEDPEFVVYNFVPDTPLIKEHSTVLSNSFGFGGTNCTIIFRKII